MLSSPRNPPSNRFDPSLSSRLTHQVKLTSSLSKTRLRKLMSRRAVDREDLQRRPGLDRRVDVVERPFVRGQRAVRMLEPLAAEQRQLVLRECRIDMRERDAVEREIPRREPRVLPRVGHRHDVEGVECLPPGVPAAEPRRRRLRLCRIAFEPARDVVVIELLAPEHPRERLAHDLRLARRHGLRCELVVELVRLGLACAVDGLEVPPRVEIASRGRTQAHARRDRLAGLDVEPVPERRLRPAGL